MEVVFDVQSCPPPTYNEASILWSLGLYTHTLDGILKRAISADNQGSIDFLQGKSSSVTAAVHNFAQALASDIIHSATHHKVGNMESEEIMSPTCYTERGLSSSSQCFFDPHANVLWRDGQECKTSNYTDEEKLAEYLASMIIKMALKEVTKHGGLRPSVLSSTQDTSGERSTEQFMHHTMHDSRHPCDERKLSECGPTEETSDEDMDTYWDESTFETASSGTRGSGTSRTIGSLFSQTSLASNQSLDYPDAPPSTPLFPGVTQSRASFCRKLKGGLAKEFLPSPPPPTPNKNPNPSFHLQTGYKERAENTSEFVERLMRSLSLECSEDADGADVSGGFPSKRPWTDWSALFDYADQLSADIIKYVTTSDDGDDFVDRLMWSLSPEYSECIEDTLVEIKENNGGPLNKTHNVSPLNDFADQLANDIIRRATTSYLSLTAPNQQGKALEQSLLPVAEHWVEEILEASYREVSHQQRTKVNTLAGPNPQSAKSEKVFTSSDVGVEASPPGHADRPTSAVHSLHRTGSQDDPHAGQLRELAEALLATSFIQAFTELQSTVLHPGTSPVDLGPPDCTSGSHRSSLQPSKRMQTFLSSGNLGQATGARQADDVADCAVERYAERFALEVIDGSLKLASKYLLGDGKTCRLWGDENGSWHSEDETTQRHHSPVVRALLGSEMFRTTNELRGTLLWAAASQLRTPTLTLVVPDLQLQTQVSTLQDYTYS